MDEVVLVHHGEIVLKGRKRGYFERHLMRNIEYVLGKGCRVSSDENRVVITAPNLDWASISTKLQYVAGVSNFTHALRCDPSLSSILEGTLRILDGCSFKTFAVEARRSYKLHPFNSMEIKKALSLELESRYAAKVNYGNPNIRIYVEVTRENAYVYREKMRGLGGLPVGSSGRVLILLSGGVDSAVASIMLIRRGCRMDYIHFHSYRSGSEALETKMGRLLDHLTKYGLRSLLFMVNFTPFYVRILNNPTRLEIPLFRRYMFEVADRVAEIYGCHAIATGDSLAQVASQTLPNMAAVEHNLKRPILRPLISHDKDGILRMAEKWGLLSLARMEYKDCCSIIGRHPVTSTRVEDLERLWHRLGMDAAVEESLAELETYAVSIRSGIRRLELQPVKTR